MKFVRIYYTQRIFIGQAQVKSSPAAQPANKQAPSDSTSSQTTRPTNENSLPLPPAGGVAAKDVDGIHNTVSTLYFILY